MLSNIGCGGGGGDFDFCRGRKVFSVGEVSKSVTEKVVVLVRSGVGVPVMVECGFCRVGMGGVLWNSGRKVVLLMLVAPVAAVVVE